MNQDERNSRAGAALRRLVVRHVTKESVAPPLPVAESSFRREALGPNSQLIPEPAPIEEATAQEAADAVESLVRGAKDALPQLLTSGREEEEIALARAAAARVAEGQPLEGPSRLVFEAVVRVADRPVFDIVNGTFGAVTPEWTVLNDHKTMLEKATRAVGRIEIMRGVEEPYAGTGFVVGPKLLMTNRHVAEIFATGVGRGNAVQLRWIQDVLLDMKHETDTGIPAPSYLKITGVKMIHPHWDMAILEVEGLQAQNAAILSLATAPPSQNTNGILAHGRKVAIIGYPAASPEHPLDVQQRVFRNTFGIKRLQPGVVTGARPLKWLEQQIVALTHDSSTLGGNSGSAVIDLETGLVIALHFSGAYMVNNFGVMAWELGRDPFIRELGVQFETPRDAVALNEEKPSWLGIWNQGAAIAATRPENVAITPTPPAVPASSDWFERTSTAELSEAMRRAPESTSSLIRATLNEEESNELIADLRRGALSRESSEVQANHLNGEGIQAEGWFDGFFPRPDPNLPDVVLLHGIMGGHLASSNGLWPRVWLNPSAFLEGNVAERLTLKNDGQMNAVAGVTLRADGHIRLSYDRTVRFLQKNGFVVHSFSFDWRKSLKHCADRLELFLQNLRLERPGKQQTILAHSMGGLVAALWAQQDPESSKSMERAVFLGAPLGGSYAPVEALMGTYDTLRKLAFLSRHDDIADMRRMSCTFPGPLEMLPDPHLFPDAEPLYRRETWPADFAPLQEWLDQSLKIKTALRQSPLLERTTMLASLAQGTVASLESNWAKGAPLAVALATSAGDGTVPGQSAVLEGLSAFQVEASHGLLPRDKTVLTAASQLLASEECELSPLTPSDVLNAGPRPETPFAEANERLVAEVRRERFEKGVWNQTDWDWLLSA